MCVDHDARLPALPIGDRTVSGDRTQLMADDETEFNAYLAQPDGPRTGKAVIVLPDVRGLFGFYEDLACHFAAHGHPSIAIDYFGRTAGTDERDAEFPYMDHIAQTTSAGLNADIAAACSYLRTDDPTVDIYLIGFCFGGNVAWGANTHGHGLAGVIGFYGKPEADRPAGDGPIWDRCHLMGSKVMALFGGADTAIPQENIDRFEQALVTAGVDHHVHTYPGAPHSFFDRSQADFSDESLDAWNRITAFMG